MTPSTTWNGALWPSCKLSTPVATPISHVRKCGSARKNTRPRASAATIVAVIAAFDSSFGASLFCSPSRAARSSSSSAAWFAANVSADRPLCRDSTRTTAPRRKGQRRNRSRSQTERQGPSRITRSPFWRRTATAKDRGLRIITPSMTACPPTFIPDIRPPVRPCATGPAAAPEAPRRRCPASSDARNRRVGAVPGQARSVGGHVRSAGAARRSPEPGRRAWAGLANGSYFEGPPR